MGVYLPNVDMPKGDKVLTVQICPDGSIWQQYRGTVPNAKAVPVPPHGRLGDLDSLTKEVEDMAKEFPPDSIASERFRLFAELIATAPTIIPAEEEGET